MAPIEKSPTNFPQAAKPIKDPVYNVRKNTENTRYLDVHFKNSSHNCLLKHKFLLEVFLLHV